MSALILLAVILFTIIGCGFGIITGLIPGIHVNLVAYMILSLQTMLFGLITFIFGYGNISNGDVLIVLAALIIGCLITHTFLDFIPSIFLGAPEGETALSVLPGHRLMLQGQGYEAVKCSALGSFSAVIVALLLLIPFRLLMGAPIYLYEKLKVFIYLILILVAALLILSEKGSERREKRFKAKKPKISCHSPEGLISIDRQIGIDGQYDEKKNVDEADEGYLEDVIGEINISEAHKYFGEAVSLVGKISRKASDSIFFIEDDTGEILVSLDKAFDVEIDEHIKIYGTVEAYSPLKSQFTQKVLALAVFLLSGSFGLILLSTPGIVTYNWYPIPRLIVDPSGLIFFPLFTGLFGLSTLLLSVIDKPSIPAQKIEGVTINLTRKGKVRGVLSGTLAGALVAWYPGISAATATVIGRLLVGNETQEHNKNSKISVKPNIYSIKFRSLKKVLTNFFTSKNDIIPDAMESQKEFIVSISSVNTSVAIFTILALFVILKARSGAMIAIWEVSKGVIVQWEPIWNVPQAMALMFISTLISAIFALFLTLYWGKRFARVCNRIAYQKLIHGVIIFLLAMILLFSGIFGLLIAGIATCIGLIPPLVGVRRVHLMGCLIIPIILFFL